MPVATLGDWMSTPRIASTRTVMKIIPHCRRLPLVMRAIASGCTACCERPSKRILARVVALTLFLPIAARGVVAIERGIERQSPKNPTQARAAHQPEPPALAAGVDNPLPLLPPVIVGEPNRIEVYPSCVRLDSSRQRMHLIVTGHYADGQLRDLTHAANMATGNEQVVRLDGSIALPAGDGTTEITVCVGQHKQTVAAHVSNFVRPAPVSFHYETLPTLTKHGCNSGGCHGSPSGKGGFRLSLQAYDAELDQLTLIREAYGRRTNPLDPEASLLLLKPTMRIAHGGGLRFRHGDPTRQLLRDWISQGCPVDPAHAPSCVRIEFYPESGRLLKQSAQSQQLVVLAHFSDGTVRDVTHLAKFSSSDEAVATVVGDGLVMGHDRGEAAIMARFREMVETFFITFVKDVEGFRWTNPPAANYIDELVYKKLNQLKFLPSELCTDEEFLRRVTLDITGSLPEIAEVEAFLSDRSEVKRAQLIDRLLAGREHARFWA